MSVLVLCPSRNRPTWAAETLASFLETRRDPGSRLVFVVDRDDATVQDYPTDHVYLVAPGGCMGAALSKAGRDPVLLGDATSVGMIGDDNRFRTPGWDFVLDGWLREHPGIAYGDDGFQHERLPTSWWVSRLIVDVFGIVDPNLRHLYMDNWWKALGEAAGCLRYFPDVVIEHLHPLAGKGTYDAIYRRGNSHGNARHDRDYFHRWQRRQLPEDARKLRRLLHHDGPRRVLADWHHPALWESLAILFEDRFGWELYSPLGLEWTQHGWRFEHASIGWKAADYLEFPDAVPVNGHFERHEPEYPDRPRKLVTWDQAQTMRWDFVLASVSDHQASFADLAKRWGATFVHQVGNAKHAVDRRLPAVILASAKGPVGRNVVTYHQEFDRRVFAPTRPTHPDRVTSFMLRLDTTSCDYRWLADARGVKWTAPGGADPRAAGYLAPMTKVAALMRDTGWVWHDKRIGDGYGHVLHNAAAMGRPLIGHASHYKGLAGEPFWRDLETCIDLDRHPPERALRLWRAISGDPDWHAEMGAAIAARFDELVNFDAEAEQIRTVLERAAP